MRELNSPDQDVIGKAGHIRTVPFPDWVKQITDDGWWQLGSEV